ncbi:MAG: hypothetical protein M1839_007107 [Geoglossum umbratile]|nr:MAG: hypothetical protein M1839_007107 [Geoglossum umbratile]
MDYFELRTASRLWRKTRENHNPSFQYEYTPGDAKSPFHGHEACGENKAERTTRDLVSGPMSDIPMLGVGTPAPTEPTDLLGIYSGSCHSGAIIHDAVKASRNASGGFGDTSIVGGPKLLESKVSKRTAAGHLKPGGVLRDNQQADATPTNLTSERDKVSIANAVRDGSIEICPSQGTVSNWNCPPDARAARNLSSWTPSNFPPVDITGLIDKLGGNAYGGLHSADGMAQQALQVKRQASAPLPQELIYKLKDEVLGDHSPGRRYVSLPAAGTHFCGQTKGPWTPQSAEELEGQLAINMSSRDSSPLSSCPPSELLDLEGDTLEGLMEEPLVEALPFQRRMKTKEETHPKTNPVRSQKMITCRSRQSEVGPTLPRRDLTAEVWEDSSGFQRRSSRPRKVPSRFIHETVQVNSLHKVPKKVDVPSPLPIALTSAVPSKRAANWPDQTEGKPEEQCLSKDAISVLQPASWKRAKSQVAECNGRDQQQEAPRVSGSGEEEGLTCDEQSLVTANRARHKPQGRAIAGNRRALPTKGRKVLLKPSNPKEAVIGEDNRPYPRGLPEVWSVGRQALCETLVYYRAYQSGAYTHDELSFGFLVDKQCGERDHMDDEIVITRAGGGLKRNPETGEMEQVADHTLKSKTVENFLNNKRNFCPVALIAGKGNPKCPTKIPYNYCVLGWFKVTDVWCERIDGMKCFKFRFEKVDLESPSWWAPAGSPDPPRPYQYPKPAIRYTCNSCSESYPKIYNEGWMCFTDSCQSFWKIDGDDPPTNLHYNPAFLKERTRWPSNVKAPYSLKPAMLADDRGNDASYSVSHACWKGFSCPKCGRCNSREDWNGWECQTAECDYKYSIKRLLLSPQALSNPHDPITDGHAISKDSISGPITEKIDFLENYRVHTYEIPDCGTITHFMANRTINERVDGPDDMFLALQQEDIGLKRFPLKNSTLTGPMLAQHFAVNHGMPYKYVIDVDSKSFKEAPNAIHHARARLNWAGKYVVEDGTFRKFNELLTLGYFEKQKINYHDDGEEGLGPTIATLSLGGQATMTIRMKSSHYHGVSRTGAYVDKYPPTKGCLNYEQRLLKHEEMQRSDPKIRGSLCKEIVKDLGLSRKRTCPVWLSMRLNHGDIILMHGVKIQTYYEVRDPLRAQLLTAGC